MEEVLDSQPPEVQELLLSMSILEQVTPEAASELVGNERGTGFWPAFARVYTFAQLIGSGGTATTLCSRRYCVSS